MSFLTLTGVKKSFGAREVLKDVDLTIERGELVAVVGFSGAGKTTLVSLIAGLYRPDAGRIVLEGAEVTGPGPDRGIVFQSYALLPWLSVYDNVALAAKDPASASRYLAMVGLAQARHKKPAQLSGGMRQRVALARALAMDPAMLLLDEPLSALDALTRAQLQSEIDRIYRESHKTVLLITNDVDEALLLADRVIPLSPGPAATLGASIAVPFPRPRRARELGHDARFQKLRAQVIEALLQSRRRPGGPVPAALAGPIERVVEA